MNIVNDIRRLNEIRVKHEVIINVSELLPKLVFHMHTHKKVTILGGNVTDAALGTKMCT